MNLIRLNNNGVDALNKLKGYYLNRMNGQITKIADGNVGSNEQLMSMELFNKRLNQINSLFGWLANSKLGDIALLKTDTQELIAEAEENFPDCVLGLRGIFVLLTQDDVEKDEFKQNGSVDGLFTSVIPYGLTNKTYLSNVATDIRDAFNAYSRDISASENDLEDIKGKLIFINDIGTLVINSLNNRNPKILDDCRLEIENLFNEIKYAYAGTESDSWFESFSFVTEIFMKECDIDRILVSRLSFTVSELTNAQNITEAIEEVAAAISDLHAEWEDFEEPDAIDVEDFSTELFELKMVMNYLMNLI